MFKRKVKLIWPVITFLIGTFIGSGAIWEFKKIQLENEKFEFEKTKESIQLREKITQTLIKINELNNEFYKLLEEDKPLSKKSRSRK